MKIHLIISDSYYFIKETLYKIYGDFDNVVKVLSFYDSLSSDWSKVKPDIEEFYNN